MTAKSDDQPSDVFLLGSASHAQQITTKRLDGTNFTSWSRSVRLYLGSRRKIGLIMGTNLKPDAKDSKYPQWEVDNYTVLSWLLNSMEQNICQMFMYYENVAELWAALTDMYAHSRNDARIYQLYKEIFQASQGSNSLAEYFGYLQTRWEELGHYEAISELSGEVAKLVAKRIERQKVYAFLMGLRYEHESLCTQILNTDPLPFLRSVFATIDSDERRRSILLSPTSSILPSPVLGISDQMALATNSSLTRPRNRGRGRGRGCGRGRDIICNNCEQPGHAISRCYKPTSSSSAPLVAVVKAPVPGVQSQIDSLIRDRLSYHAGPSASTSTSPSSTSSAFHATTSGSVASPWVIDSGASDHMTGPEFEEDFW